VGDCASRLDYFIEPIAEKCMADMESSDESNHPIVAHHIAPIFDDRQEQENLSSSMGVDDDVQYFICSTISVASHSVKSRTRHCSRELKSASMKFLLAMMSCYWIEKVM
jgi:hypothetical protein